MQPPKIDPRRSSNQDQQKVAACLFRGTQPVVSAIMPTYGRPELVGESVAMFLAQNYPHKELIILNDCDGQIFHFNHPQVTVINQVQRFATLGEKRNACIELAKGEVIAVWDDDDVYLPWRFEDAVSEMSIRRAAFYRPSEFWAYWGNVNLHDNLSTPDWVNHGFCCFTKKIWKAVGGYPPQNLGEDAIFFDRIHQFLELPFVTMPVLKYERSAILRGTSPYEHLCMNGGKKPLDLTPGEYKIRPIPIADNHLRHATESLIAVHAECVAKSTNSYKSKSLREDVPALSICVSLKNRSRVVYEDRVLELFPKCVAAIAESARELCRSLPESDGTRPTPSNGLIIELVIADFSSDDWPLSEWVADAASGLKLNCFCLDKDFSRGHGLNIAAKQASSDRLLLLDADVLVTPQLILAGIESIDQRTAYFPIFRYLNIHGAPLGLEPESFGNVFLSKHIFDSVGGVPEFQSWGGEDDVFYEQVSKIASIRRDAGDGFFHQWHPEHCRHENYLHPPRTDYNAYESRKAAARHVRTFIVSHRDWAGKLFLHPDGMMQACNGDEGRYEWSDESVLSLFWNDWPVETLLPSQNSGQWKAEEYHFVIEELPASLSADQIA